MDPQAKIHVPESAKKDKVHKHEFSFDGIDAFMCIHADCQQWIDMDEAERRLNVVELLRNAEDGIYIGNQLRELANG